MNQTLPHGPAPSGPLGLLRHTVRAVDAVSMWAIVLCMAGMAACVSAQVFQRYAMNSSIDAADELSRLFFVWSIFLAIPHGIPRGIHVGIDLFLDLVPAPLQTMLNRVSALAGLVLMVFVFQTTIQATSDKWGELMPTLPFTAALYYVPVLICAGHAAMHLVLLAAGGERAWQDDAAAEVAE